MKKIDLAILGAGVGGLGAACWAQEKGLDYRVIEAQNEVPVNLHNGVHYLHSIPELPFDPKLKEIRLTDGILDGGEVRHTPNLFDALYYSEKVRMIQHPSSIFEVGKTDKVYLPVENSLNGFIKMMEDYIEPSWIMFGSKVEKINAKKKTLLINGKETEYNSIISTIPLHIMANLIGIEGYDKLKSIPINIVNFPVDRIVPNWLINLYVPSLKEKAYRGSVMNNQISIESIDTIEESEFQDLETLFSMFHIDFSKPSRYKWEQGKIISLDIDSREKMKKEFLDMDIIQIGRFGTWDNKLLVDTTINQSKVAIELTAKNNIL